MRCRNIKLSESLNNVNNYSKLFDWSEKLSYNGGI